MIFNSQAYGSVGITKNSDTEYSVYDDTNHRFMIDLNKQKKYELFIITDSGSTFRGLFEDINENNELILDNDVIYINKIVFIGVLV